MPDDKLKLVEPPERAPRIRKDYVPRLDRDEYIAMLGLSEAEAALCTLTDEELAFVCEMLSNGLDKVKAYSAVNRVNGKLSKTQYRKVAAVIRKPEVRQLLRQGVERKMSETLDNLDARLLDTYITRAFYDIKDFVDSNGEPLLLTDIPDNLRCVIDGVEKKYYGKDAEAYTITFKLANRDQALKVLSEYMSIVRPNSDVPVTTTAAENEDEEIEKLSEMSEEELRAALGRSRTAGGAS